MVPRNCVTTAVSLAWVLVLNVPGLPALVPTELDEQAERLRLRASNDPTSMRAVRERAPMVRGWVTGSFSRGGGDVLAMGRN